MTISVRSWEIVDDELQAFETSIAQEGHTGQFDLEAWIAAEPPIRAPDLIVTGRQVMTRSVPLHLLAIDNSGNLVIVELKRDMLPRQALAQAIDYATDVASWTVDRGQEEFAKFTGHELADVLADAFPDIDVESISINETQWILLVGFAVEGALEASPRHYPCPRRTRVEALGHPGLW